LTIKNINAKRAMDMKRVMRVTAGAVLCLALTDYWCAAKLTTIHRPGSGQASNLRRI
jgi:hypothetical protein